MTNKEFYLAFGQIDPKMIESAEPHETSQIKKSHFIRWSAIAASFMFLILGSFILKSLFTDSNFSEAGGLNGKINITEEIKITGKEYIISDYEATEYLNRVKNSITNDLNACGIHVSQIDIKKTGYSHVRTGDQGNSIAVNWYDYLAYSEEKLVAIIQITKDETGIHHFLMFGGDWFPEYTKILNQHKGTELVFLYIGDVEAFITPDNQVIPLIESDISSALEENQNYYEYFKTPYNVYIP